MSAKEEARNSGLEESKRERAERIAIGAIRRAEAAESSYSELEKKKEEQDEVMQQLQSATDKHISDIKNLEMTVKKLFVYKTELDELWIKLENALQVADELRKNQAAESVKRENAEIIAIGAIRRAEATESSYSELEKKKEEQDEVMQQLQIASDKHISDIKNLEMKVKKLFVYKTKRDGLRIKLENALQVADELRKNQAAESVKRENAERIAIGAIRRAEATESFYSELEKKKKEQDEVVQQLQSATDKHISDIKNLEMKVKKLFVYKTKRDGLRIKLENALQVADELRKNQAAETSSSTTYLHQFISEFSLAEIEEATHSFHPSLKIGEGGFGSVYKGLLGQTQVAIKKLHSNGFLQGPSEYQQEVKVLGKLRHPNLIALIGACREVWALVYEYLPNGSLCAPLSWQTRIRIAAELCSVLVFLHSSKPHGIVHGDLKPDNILLVTNLVSKLSDFGICRVISHNDNSSSSNRTVCHRTEPKGTLGYIDPEFLTTGELNPKSDVYSFGIILLRLLTGRPTLGLTNEVQRALHNRDLKSLLDYTAGDWPYVQAQQMAHLGLRCAEANRRDRPDLGLEVWRVLELMRATSGGASSSLRLIQAPSYFICPILMDVMQDPHVAADGFTYEAEAIRGWLDSGHDTSPMTNVELEHTNLVPNLTLRSAIQEWLQEQ